MAKRFTDTEIWDKEWFMSLSCRHKCLIRFIFDKCDVAGVWSPNWVLATAYIGEQVTEEDLKVFGDRIQKIGPSKFFIEEFVSFQYGELSDKCKPHQKVISILKKYNLLDSNNNKIKGYPYPLDRVEEKEEEEEKDKATEKAEGGVGETEPEPYNPDDFVVPEIIPEGIDAEVKPVTTEVFVDEEEYAAALQFLKGNQMFFLTQMQRGIDEKEATRLFRIFYEQKVTFKDMPKKPLDVVKNFFYWTSKYMNSPEYKRTKGSAAGPAKGTSESKVQNLVNIAQTVQFTPLSGV